MNRMIFSHRLSQARSRVWGILFAAWLSCCLTASAQTVPAPTFYPGDGSLVPTNVTIASVVQDATVYYTTDGSFPTTNAIRYTGPLALTNTTTLWAKAFKAGWTDSADVMATFYYRPALVSVQKLVVFDDSLKPSVNIAVTPTSDVKCYAVQEVVPMPLLVTNINLGGVWDAASRTIVWGPFSDNQSRSLTYQVSGDNGIYQLASQISLNGYSTWANDITTTATLTLSNVVSTVATPVFAVPSQVSIISNGSFEFPALGGANFIYYNSMSAAQQAQLTWVGGGNGGAEPALFANGSGWNYVNVPDGTQGISLQSTATIAQTVNFLSAGNYTLSWLAASRNGQVNPYVVQLDGIILPGTHSTANTTWQSVSTTFPVTNAGNHTVTFVGLNTSGGDNSVGLDSISLTQTPIPNSPITLTITDATPGSMIYYTLDGTVPTSSSKLYTGPFAVTNPATVRAIAMQSGWYSSDVSWISFDLAAPAATVRSITNSPSPAPLVLVTVNPATNVQSYAVEETLPMFLQATNISNGGTWDATSGTVRWGPFEDNTNRVFSYAITGPDGTSSLTGVVSFDGRSYPIQGDSQLVVSNPVLVPLPAPTFAATNGILVPTQVAIADAVSGAEIHYTLDGSLPLITSPVYTLPLNFTNPATLRARAFLTGWLPSDPVAADFSGAALASTVTRSVTTYTNASWQEIHLSAAPTADVTSYAVQEQLPLLVTPTNISANGIWDPQTGIIRWGPFQDGLPRILTNQVTGPAGSYTLQGTASFNGQSVAVIGDTSLVLNQVVLQPAATPVIAPASATSLPVTVSISDATAGADVYYTTDGSVPTQASAHYTGQFQVIQPLTLRSRAFASGYSPSDVAGADYSTLTVVAGSATRSVNNSGTKSPTVSLSLAPTGAAHSYAVAEILPAGLLPTSITSGGVWDATNSTIRWGPFQDSNSRMLNYTLAGADGNYSFNGVASFDGQSLAIGGTNAASITGSISFVATPVISPADGSTLPVNVGISCATPGAVVYYTLDSTVPTTNSFLYTGSFYPARAGTVRAKAFASGYIASDTASATYFDAPSQSAGFRTITGSPSRIQTVQVSFAPASTVKTWAVQETLPVMLWPSAISDGGLWHVDSGTIEWGPFMDHTARNLSYTVSGMDGTYAISGLTSFDGKSYATAGNSTVYIYFPAPTNLVAVAGNQAVYLRWPRISGARGYNVHFWAAGAANNVQIRDAGTPDIYFGVAGLTNSTQYYFTVAAYDSQGHEGELSPVVSAIPCADCGAVGDVWFDQVYYNATNTYAVVTVQDPNLSGNTNIQAVTAQITSDSDAWGISVVLTKTATNSSLFTSQATGTNVGFTLGNSDNTNKLIHVLAADRIYVSYTEVQPSISLTNSAYYDSAVPQTVLSVSGPLQYLGATNVISRISACVLTATDVGSGVASTLISLDGGAWTAYTNQIQFTTDGPHTIDFYSTDFAGNVESTHHQPLLVQTMTPQFGPSQMLVNGSIQLAIFGEYSGTYTLQISTNLVDWVPLSRFTCYGSPTYITDTAAGAYSQRFYRLVAP